MKRMCKTACLLLAALSSCLLLTGCLHPVQLNQRAIVQAVGIDWKDGNIQMTFQIFSPSGEGSSISANADNAKIISASGPTVSEAVQNATLSQGKQLFVGHARIIIVGRALAERGLEQPLSYFSANAWSRQSVHLAVAEDTAAEILTTQINQGILPAETLEKISENAEENGVIQNIRLYEFLKALVAGHESSVLPLLRLKQGEEGSDGSEEGNGPGGKKEGGQKTIDEVSSVEMAGMAVFSGAKLAGTLTGEESRGLLWARDAVHRTVLTVHTSQYETVVLRVYESSATLTPEVSEGPDGLRILFTLAVNCEAAVGESLLRPGAEIGQADVEELAHAGEAIIRQESQAAFQRAVRELRADVLELGSRLWMREPALWKNIQAEWGDILPKLDFHVEATIDLDRVGMEYKTAR